MAVRRSKPVEEGSGVPPELYWGLVPGAFAYFGADDPRSSEEQGQRRVWAQQVRAAGYTPASLREVAATDPGFQRWLAFRERKRRLLAEDHDRKTGQT